MSSHGWKVNFCKFTNETRNGIEDSSKHSRSEVCGGAERRLRRRRLRAGPGLRRHRAGGRPLLPVSLPEVPLLGVLPGTGGLTRVTDKRHVRHDLADIFCTSPKACAARRRSTGAWWTRSPSRRCSSRWCASALQRPPAAPARPSAQGVALTRWNARKPPQTLITPTSRC